MKQLSRWMVRTVAVSVGASSIALGVTSAAHACSCMMPRPVATAASYDGVFVGTTGQAGPRPPLSREVEVSSVFKGDPGREIVVETGMGGQGGFASSCDFMLPVDRTFVFFADHDHGAWRVMMCNPLEKPTPTLLAALEDRLGPPHQPQQLTANPPTPSAVDEDEPSAAVGPTSDDDSDVLPWAVAGAAALVVVGAGVGITRRHRS
jgi:hypothetical protein